MTIKRSGKYVEIQGYMLRNNVRSDVTVFCLVEDVRQLGYTDTQGTTVTTCSLGVSKYLHLDCSYEEAKRGLQSERGYLRRLWDHVNRANTQNTGPR